VSHFFTSSIWHSTRQNLGNSILDTNISIFRSNHLYASVFHQPFFNLLLGSSRPTPQASVSRELLLDEFSNVFVNYSALYGDGIYGTQRTQWLIQIWLFSTDEQNVQVLFLLFQYFLQSETQIPPLAILLWKFI
jgi:hypothetical protein